MISPELLRRYPFYGPMSDEQLRAIAMITEKIELPEATMVLHENQPADHLYLLLEGGIDLIFHSQEEYHPKNVKTLPVGEINPEEVFGVSSLIEPFHYNASAITSQDSKILVTDAKALRELVEQDTQLGCKLMQQIAKAVMERLVYTRIQLAAAWA